MEALFDAITRIDRWLQQRYRTSDDGKPGRVFWNQIMVTAGIIHLKQLGLPVTQGNLERYTPIKPSSIYRTLKFLDACDVIKTISEDPESYDFKGDVPSDILELTTNRTTVDINGVVSELRGMMKSAVRDALHGLHIDEKEIDFVTERLDAIEPEKKKLDSLSDLVGEGFL